VENRELNIFFARIKSNFQGPASGVIFLSVIICLLLTLPARAETDPILAEVGEHKITLKDLENKISRIQEGIEEGSLNLDKEALLLEMVRLEVFAKEALVLGLEKDKAVKARINGLKNDLLAAKDLQKEDTEVKDRIKVYRSYILATEYLQKEVNDKISIDDRGILQYFKENRFKYVEPEKIKARQIYLRVNTEGEIDGVRDKAERLSDRLKEGEDFIALAKVFSEDSLFKDKGGDLGYFARGRLVPELEEPVFHLREGEISPVLKTKGGFHIFKLEDRIERRLLEYDEARERIKKTLKAEKGNELYKALEEKLFKKYEVKIYKDQIPPTPLVLAPDRADEGLFL
jgi:parvulin-like peptidyl-prolyl isomerase